MKNRYENLYKIIDEIKPRTILEVGTHNGVQARKMVKQAQEHRSEYILYFGFDLWEELSLEEKEHEHCGKSIAEIKLARNNLGIPRCSIRLYQGNTKETLKEFAYESDAGFIDFAFIDGGHSIETIRSDWENVRKVMKPGGVVIFDDFYTWPPNAADYEIGCNLLITDLTLDQTHLVTYLDSLDSDPNCAHKIRMVRVDIR